MSRNTIGAIALLVGGVLILAAVPALAQSGGAMPMHDGGGMGMHGQVSQDQIVQMQQLHEQMPAEVVEQMQAWHQRQGMPGMMRMMGGTSLPAMYAQMPHDLQDQLSAWHAQLPEDLNSQMQAMHNTMASMHAGQVPEGIESASPDAEPNAPPTEDVES